MVTISIANNKGGVGKTSTCVNLAGALAKQKKKILLIDLDSQSSLTIYYGIEPLELKYSIYDVLIGKCRSDDALIKLEDNINILPATIELSSVDLELNGRIGREYVLKKALSSLAKDYDYILIDNGPNFGLLTINSMTASDYVIAPCQPEYLALRGLEILMNSIENVKEINPKLKLMGVLITMYNITTSHHAEVITAIKNTYPTFKSIIKKSVKFADSCLAKETIYDYAGTKFEGSKQYLEMAKEVMNIVKEGNS